MNSEEVFLSELRSQLMEAHRAAPRRRRRGVFGPRGLLAAAVVLAVAVAAVVFAPFGGDQAAADVEAFVDDGWIQVRLLDLENRPAEIAEAASSVGLDLKVLEVPVGPSHVGRFVSLEADTAPAELLRLGVEGATFTGFRIPEGFDGSFTLNVGRTARPGEEWLLASPASDAIGARCEQLLGATVAEAAEMLDGEESRWFAAEPGSAPIEFSPSESEFADYLVFMVTAPSDDEVWLQVSPDGTSPFPDSYPTEDTSC